MMAWNDHLIMNCIAGSRMYGTATSESDFDYLGVAVPPQKYLLGLSQVDSHVYSTSDGSSKSGANDVEGTTYSLQKFARLASKGNPNLVSLLFVPGSLQTVRSPHWDLLQENAPAFISKQVYFPFMGYAKSQRSAMEGHRAAAVQRPDLVAKYGYDTKFAMHMIRLSLQGKQLLDTGKLVLPMTEEHRTLLTGIRLGEYSREQVLDMADAAMKGLSDSYDSSDLPAKPDYVTIDEMLIHIHQTYWKGL